MAQLNFNANEVVPDAGRGDPIPDAWYNLMVDDSDIKPTQDSATTGGAYLAVRMTVMDGDHKGRKIFTNFNIRNANPVAQEIAYKQLSALAHAVGVLMVQDSTQLHGIPFKGRVKIRKGGLKNKNNPAEGNYEDSNEITMYKNINEPTPSSGPTPPAMPGVPAAGGFAGFSQPMQPVQPQPQQWAQPPAQPPQQGFAPQPWGQPPQPQQAQQQPPQPQQAPPTFAPPPQAASPAPQTAPPGWSQDASGQWVQQQPVQQPVQQPAPPAAAPAAAAAQSLTPPWARQS